MRAITLAYHDVVEGGYASSGFQSPDANLYKLSRAAFTEHLAAFQRRGLSVGMAGEPAREQGTAVLLTFDDGGASGLECIAGLLEERGWRGHFFIASDYIGRPGFLNAAQIRELRRRGHAVGSHSRSHPARISKLPRKELVSEWRDSVEALSEIVGEAVEMGATPGGFYSREVAAAAARAGIRILFNSEPTVRESAVGDCRVLGRYSITRKHSAEEAAAIAGGDRGPRWRQYLFWNAKKALKTAGGEYWLEMRRRILARTVR